MKEPREILSVNTNINQSSDLVWKIWTDENQLKYWVKISDDYEVKNPKINLQIGGRFSWLLSPKKNKEIDFEYAGVYKQIIPNTFIQQTLNDGRNIETRFTNIENTVNIELRFEAVSEQDNDIQINAWQAILDNFKKYSESIRV